MGEPYAVRWTDGKRTVYKTKKDYEMAKLSSYGRTNQRLYASFSK
jgi:hypothetical protein